jgi:ADP-ribose pyrophosphatase
MNIHLSIHGRTTMSDSETRGGTEPGLIERRPVHQGRIVDLGVDTVRYPDGSTGELEMIRHSGAAAVLPVLSDPDGPDPQIVLIRQYRYAAGGWLYEVPAGRPDRPGEPWDECARRELREETGLEAGTLTPLTAIWTTPGFTDERIHLFMATELKAGQTEFDADEFVETVTLPLSEALRMVRDGEISDGKTICTLLYAAGFVFGR